MSLLDASSRRTLLVLDWDKTLSKSDTLSLIAPSPEALSPYTQAYMQDYAELKKKHGDLTTLPKMTAFLDDMQAVEYMSVDRVERGGLFNGMSRASLLERARDSNLLSLQAGAAEFLKTHKGPWGIVSVGWSGIFIREALQSRGVDLTKHNVQIQANEVIFNQHGMGTGEISKHQSNAQGIRTARDKLREMRKMVDTWRSQESDSGGESRVVYIGDSETDLLCLLHADIGIIMADESMAEKCEKLGIQVIKDAQGEVAAAATEGPPLRFVKNFEELVL